MYISHKAMTAEHCLDTVKDYLIGMVESWDGSNNLHTGIISIVNSFGSKDYKYLSLRYPSGVDSGVTTSGSRGASASSLPRKSRPSKESPLAMEPPLVPPRPIETFTPRPHKLSLQDSYRNKSENEHRKTVNSVMPVRGVAENTSTAFPHAETHNLPTHHVRHKNQPIIPPQRSFVYTDPVKRRTSAPTKLISGSGAQASSVGRQESDNHFKKVSDHHISTTQTLPYRSRSERRPGYPPPLPKRRHSDSVDSSAIRSSKFSPTLDDFTEDEEDIDEEDSHYSVIGALDYIVPKQHREADHKTEGSRNDVESQPNIGKLQKELQKRNSTLKKRKRPSLHKRSFTHSSDASSDDSDAGKRKFKLERRVSSYHPQHKKTSVTRSTAVRRKTAGSLPISSSPMEITVQLPDQEKSRPPIQPTSDGDSEATEHLISKQHEVRHVQLEYLLVFCLVANTFHQFHDSTNSASSSKSLANCVNNRK